MKEIKVPAVLGALSVPNMHLLPCPHHPPLAEKNSGGLPPKMMNPRGKGADVSH